MGTGTLFLKSYFARSILKDDGVLRIEGSRERKREETREMGLST
jgi:hypothetical protein